MGNNTQEKNTNILKYIFVITSFHCVLLTIIPQITPAMTNIKQIIPWALTIILFFIGLQIGCEKGKQVQPKKDEKGNKITTKYVTDTIYRIKYKTILPEKNEKIEEPRVITKYLEKLVLYRDPKLLKQLQVLSDSVFVYKAKASKIPDTITKYDVVNALNTPQLTFGKFSKDSIRLDFRKVDGTMQSNAYWVDYNIRDYTYRKGQLSYNNIPRSKLPREKKVYSGVFLFGGWDLLQESPVFALDYNFLSFKNIEPRARMQFGYDKVDQKLQPQIQLGISYRVK